MKLPVKSLYLLINAKTSHIIHLPIIFMKYKILPLLMVAGACLTAEADNSIVVTSVIGGISGEAVSQNGTTIWYTAADPLKETSTEGTGIGVDQGFSDIVITINESSGSSSIPVVGMPNGDAAVEFNGMTLNLKSANLYGATATIYRTDGTIAYRQTVSEENTEIDLSRMSEGAYILTLTSSENIITTLKFIKK